MKNKVQFKIGLLCGLIPLTVGLLLFLIWWTARAFFAFDLYSIEAYGFLWILISIPIAATGLLLLTIFAFNNSPNFIQQSVLGISLILINLPVTYWITIKQTDLKKRAFVKISHQNGATNLLEIRLKSRHFEEDLGELESGSSTIFYFYPKAIDETSKSSGPEMEPVTLVLKTQKQETAVELPRIDKGQCVKFNIDKNLQLVRVGKR